jgi:hypothetical protein
VQFRGKQIFFVIDVKKTKQVSQKALFLALKFVFLHNPNDKLIFHAKTLWSRIVCFTFTTIDVHFETSVIRAGPEIFRARGGIRTQGPIKQTR